MLDHSDDLLQLVFKLRNTRRPKWHKGRVLGERASVVVRPFRARCRTAPVDIEPDDPAELVVLLLADICDNGYYLALPTGTVRSISQLVRTLCTAFQKPTAMQ